jgi:hypothetical protein
MNTNVQLSIRQFVGAWQLMCGASPGFRSARGDGIEYAFSGLSIGFFNAAILTRTSRTCSSSPTRRFSPASTPSRCWTGADSGR